MTTENTPQSTALVTIDPPSYVQAVYEPFQKRLDDAMAQADGVTYDITTKTGMDTAKGMRALFREIRISCDKKRAECKAPILEIGKLLDSRNKEIEAKVAPFEDRFDADIKAEEKRIEDEKIAKLKAETERQSALQAKIDAIKNAPLTALNLSADSTQGVIDQLLQIVADEENYQERFVEAEIALKTSIEQLNQMVAGKRAQEELAAKAEAEAKAQADAKAEAEAKAREAQAAEAERLKAEREELDRQRAEIAKARAELEEKQKAEAEAKKKLEEAKTVNPVMAQTTIQDGDGIAANEPESSPVQLAEAKREAVIEHQDEISEFLKSRTFKDESRIRAVLVEFVAFQRVRALKEAA